jgi:predicted  nucleic acid-binding Zn-ribbon protein
MNTEIKTLNEKLVKMQTEIDNKFNKSERYKEDCEQKVKRLLRNLTDLNEQKAVLEKDVRNAEYDFELKDTKLQRNENFSRL